MLAEPPKMSPKGEKCVVISIIFTIFVKLFVINENRSLTILQLSKMKKLIFMLATMLPLMFVACNDNENDEKQPKHQIVGLWELEKAYIEEDDRWWYAKDDISDMYQLEVKNDGSGKFTHYSNFNIIEEPFTWQVVENQFRLVMPDNTYQAYKIEQISDEQLILTKDLVTKYYKRRE